MDLIVAFPKIHLLLDLQPSSNMDSDDPVPSIYHCLRVLDSEQWLHDLTRLDASKPWTLELVTRYVWLSPLFDISRISFYHVPHFVFVGLLARPI